MLAEQVGRHKDDFRVKQQRVKPDKTFFQKCQELACAVNAVDIIECDHEAAQYEEEIDEQARVDHEKVVVKNRILECIMVMGDNEDRKNAP